MSLASSSGDRVGSVLAEGVAGVISRTGASLVRGRLLGIGSVGCTRHPSKKYIPDKGRKKKTKQTKNKRDRYHL